ncbi:MBL fold metallo-hydrolase [Cellulomonas fengjieae]|uniref:MBL fold metallo-hydrolase n=1 Tax=Cellulomonas fengjieae TaxID=2819978 RepID=A0ABS3SKB1_9CELL|nr:MBL fold metallo-hydrolase [Cellulomonas fengjieae]MBO3086187.1 MBL fold metallo-hydrolase [Cellulomonas fengjieae]QVI65756.1 MBL fold metallo-hydrolase [Cellulomonas fengjieae]
MPDSPRRTRPSFWICATCAVESAERLDVCPVCADERQWVPGAGQRWTTLEELRAEGYRASLTALEPDLYALTSTPSAGIGQQSKLLVTSGGSLLWDPIGFLDDEVVERILALGPVRAIAASHPHMYGVQVEWSRALGDPPVYVAEADARWINRPDPVIRTWSGELEVLPGVTLSQPGGHFPGSAVAHWPAGADGRGVLLSGDTLFANPDRRSVAFMRSYPNHLPLSGAVARRVADAVDDLAFDRLYGNFANVIASEAKDVVRRSAARHIGWVNGDFDHLT